MFTAVIPTIGRDSLTRAVASILDQSYRPQSILVIHNGRYPLASTVERICRVIRAPSNSHPAYSRNLGATLAETEYVAFLDDDDCWDAEYLEKAQQIVLQEKSDVLFSACKRRSDHGVERIDIPRRRSEISASDLRFYFTCGGSNTVVRQKFFIEFGGYDVRLRKHEDIDLFYRLIIEQVDWSVNADPVVEINDNSADKLSMSSGGTFDALRIYARYYSKFNAASRAKNRERLVNSLPDRKLKTKLAVYCMQSLGIFR